MLSSNSPKIGSGFTINDTAPSGVVSLPCVLWCLESVLEQFPSTLFDADDFEADELFPGLEDLIWIIDAIKRLKQLSYNAIENINQQCADVFPLVSLKTALHSVQFALTQFPTHAVIFQSAIGLRIFFVNRISNQPNSHDGKSPSFRSLVLLESKGKKELDNSGQK
jgi:hypothetical protein